MCVKFEIYWKMGNLFCRSPKYVWFKLVFFWKLELLFAQNLCIFIKNHKFVFIIWCKKRNVYHLKHFWPKSVENWVRKWDFIDCLKKKEGWRLLGCFFSRTKNTNNWNYQPKLQLKLILTTPNFASFLLSILFYT